MKFELNEREKESAEIFEKKHLNCAKKHPSTIGGAVTYCFTPTGVGLSISIKCNICNKEKDITDYESW